MTAETARSVTDRGAGCDRKKRELHSLANSHITMEPTDPECFRRCRMADYR